MSFPGRQSGDSQRFEKLAVRREALAESLFRSCGLGAAPGADTLLSLTTRGYDAPGVASIILGGKALRSACGGTRLPISKAAKERNLVVEKSTEGLFDATSEMSALGKFSVRRHASECSDVPLMVDSKQLGIEIENVANELRNLINGVDTRDTTFDIERNDDRGKEGPEDEDEVRDSLHQRLLKYRYVRKIEPPIPPLELLTDIEHRPRRVDKMEANLTPFRISWQKCAKERAHTWNQETDLRIGSARERREEALDHVEAAVLESLAQKDKSVEHKEALKMQMVERLRVQASIREEKVLQAKQRREEAQAKREQRLNETLALNSSQWTPPQSASPRVARRGPSSAIGGVPPIEFGHRRGPSKDSNTGSTELSEAALAAVEPAAVAAQKAAELDFDDVLALFGIQENEVEIPLLSAVTEEPDGVVG